MAIEIVDFPIKNGDFPLLFVGSPEGRVYGLPNQTNHQKPSETTRNHQKPRTMQFTIPSICPSLGKESQRPEFTMGWEDFRSKSVDDTLR